ncbi:transmembrane protein 94 isoform X1 [Onthophagus taurus]|uniref:transmembrane protein 94 isoform X1 n=1 Tax=Onthophagus taurus TaxID=166361 RepID=UPI0039BE9CEB
MEQDLNGTGLATKEALKRLHGEIASVLNQFKASQKNRKLNTWITKGFLIRNKHATVNFLSLFFSLLCIILLIVTYYINSLWIYLVEALILLFLLIFNGMFQYYDRKLRYNEIPNRVNKLLDILSINLEKIKWGYENYPQIHLPPSPCITLQWTYRDNKIVNLPWALLVTGDVILMRPGQLSPGYCEAIDKNTEFPILHSKEMFSPNLRAENEIFSIPKSRKPLECKKYRLKETPYIDNLKIALEQALDRPVSLQNQQRHYVMVQIMERIILPTFFLLVLLLNLFRYFYLERFIGKSSTLNLFLLIPVSTVLPFLPLLFPITWSLLNSYGVAHFKALYDENCQCSMALNDLEENDTFIYHQVKCDWKVIWRNFLDVVRGESEIISRTTNIVHVLGSVTALCCVDKKGILSWPNPTAEKVFFLRNSDNLSKSSSLNSNLDDIECEIDENLTNKEGGKETSEFNEDCASSTVGEVLDLTHNQSDPFKLHFDDRKWEKFLTSLKPLGLSILLNTCNIDTQEHYTTFCSHITCEAMYNENLVPVINRRCLCELAKEIGFLDQAHKIFALEQQLSTFRHLQPEMVRRDNKYARSLSMSTKLKFPFPHMFAVAVKELSSGSVQLLSQGTADIILDSCVDFWDGYDLCPLTPADRKKIQDFYQRSSLTAYCTAFAYRPLSKGVSNKLSEVYLELPSDSRHLYRTHRSPTPVHWDCSKNVLEPKIKTPLAQFYSTDSLLYNDSPSLEACDAESCFDMQCNQVFIGMVTMQYQAQSDMVQLIEQLERACIRFVHFSKENELRSRVFSEKMGLESGWNCHISLLSDRIRLPDASLVAVRRGTGYMCEKRRISQSARRLHTTLGSPTHSTKLSNLGASRAMSFSAPSAINTDYTVVKFENEIIPMLRQEDKCNSNESVHDPGNPHDWQSMSHLTNDSSEHSAPINFDMSNRAKLPRGIDKIRPHIEKVDNVPLLVSLFTDCTASVTREMLQIMQDYDEVVCVIGSSASNENMGIFMQADASISVEPLYPQVCQKLTPYDLKNLPKDVPSPIDLSRKLNSIACSLSMKREQQPIPIHQLIRESRHFVSNLWNCVQFWLCCSVTISFVQLLTNVFMLPALLTPGQVLWLVCFVVPLLSVSLMASPFDKDIMKKPQPKNQIAFNKDVVIFALWCYGSKFTLLIVIVILTYAATVATNCNNFCFIQNCTCLWFYLPHFDANSTFPVIHSDFEFGPLIIQAQNVSLILIVLHLVPISAGFVFRQHLFIKKKPYHNLIWTGAVIIITIFQLIYSAINMFTIYGDLPETLGFNPMHGFLIFGCLSPVLTLVLNEVIKKHEIKVNLRYQRRARLDFGTKLGMNSPF